MNSTGFAARDPIQTHLPHGNQAHTASASSSLSGSTPRSTMAMAVSSLDNHSLRQPSQAAMDVKLPPIRSLGSFDGSPNAGAPAPPPVRQDSFPHRPALSDHSPHAGRSSLPPLPRFSDPRSRAEQQLPTLSQSGQAYHSSATKHASRSPEIGTSSRLPPVRGTPHMNANSRPSSVHDSPPEPSESRATFSHPFFDRGKDKADVQEIERSSSSPSLGARIEHLHEVERSLQIARAIVLDGLNGHALSQSSLDAAIEAAGRAWLLLRDAGASPGEPLVLRSEPASDGRLTPDLRPTPAPTASVQSLLSHLPRDRRAAVPASSSTAATHSRAAGDGFPREGARLRIGDHGPVPSGSIFGLNHKSPSTVANAIPDRQGNASRSGYVGQDVAVSGDAPSPRLTQKEPRPLTDARPLPPSLTAIHALPTQPNDEIPRPPTSVIRSDRYESQNASLHRVPADKETSFMYAPSSIRKRLAAMYGQDDEQADSGPPPSSQGGQNHADRPLPPPAASVAPFQPWPKHSAGGTLPPPPSTLSQTIPPPYHSEHDHLALERRVPPSDSATKYKKRSRAPAPSSCKGCGTNETPEWRRGPDGARTLCNACGLHFAKVSKRKTTAMPDSAPDPGYHPSHHHGIGPIDPSQKSLYN